MLRITVDSATIAKLGNADALSELQDETGRVFAYLMPTAPTSVYAELDAQISEEELDRRVGLDGCRQLSEILGDLERDHPRDNQ